MKRRLPLLISFTLLLLLPLIGCFLKNGWGVFPNGYGLFPAQKVESDPPFNLTIFIIFSGVAVLNLLFLVFPKLFGFKKIPVMPPPVAASTTQYPPWFRPAVVVWLISWFIMWARIKALTPLDYFMFVPLWWSFIFVLDGIVYKRNNGKSLVSTYPDTLKIMAVASSFSWFVFEYQNFFVIENWYYPNYQLFSNFGNISWQLLSYTTVLPAIFQWYWLLRTFPALRNRYGSGRKIVISTPVLKISLVIGLSFSLLMGYFPYALFWLLWVSLIPALVPTMELYKFWTPFSPIARRGDWSPVILVALATLCNGFFWEFWNFGSKWFHGTEPTNPNFWKYSVPYVDVLHVFSEMPLLGYFGYLYFGIGCWILWVIMAHIFGFNPTIHQDDGTD